MNHRLEKNNVATGLMIGGFAVLGTFAGAGIGFLSGGGTSGFLNNGWISMLNGTLIGSALSVGLGLLWLSTVVKHINTAAALRFVTSVILGSNIAGFVMFLVAGGISEFTNFGWLYQLVGLIFGGLLSTGIGLITWSRTLNKGAQQQC